MRISPALLLAGAATAAIASSAHAQTTPANAPAQASAARLEPDTTSASSNDEPAEIVVTAQRREQALSDVGLSITAVGSATLTTRNVTAAEDLAKLVPGLSVSDSGFSTPIYTLRGVGVNEPSIGSSSSVAVYVDEIPLAFPVTTQGATLDLQRVEVLKGPQGTLYGLNSTGGAINYIANKPTDQLAAGLTATIGRFTRGYVDGYVSGPITDTLKARVAMRYNFGSGWQRSLTRDATLGRVKSFTGRGIVEWTPASNFKVTLNANGWTDDSDTIAPQLLTVFPGNAFNVDRRVVVLDTMNPASCSVPVNRLPGCPINAATGTRVTSVTQLVVTRPDLIPGKSIRRTDWDPGQDFSRTDRFQQYSGRIEWGLADDVTLTSLTSYSHLKRQQRSEFDGIAISQELSQFQVGRINSFAQELRLTADFSSIHWLLGANYGHDRTNDNVLQLLPNSSQVQNIAGFPSNGGGYRANQRIEDYAVFTNIDIGLTDQLTVSGGIRLSKDVRNFTGCGYVFDAASAPAYTALVNTFRAGAGLPPVPLFQPGQCYSIYTTAAAQRNDLAGLPLLTSGQATRKLSQDNVPWNVNVNFKPTSSSLIYARVSRGFKAGNFSALNTTDLQAYNPVVQEKLTAYELGARARLGRLLSVEGALFQYDYVDKQLRARINVGPPFGNINAQDTIPKSRLRGAEFSASLRPVSGLTLSASGTYIDSKIRQYVGQTVDGVLRDLAGSRFNFTPKYSVNGDVNYNRPITNELNGFAGVNVAYRSKTSAVFAPPRVVQSNLGLYDIDAYTLVDGQLGVEEHDGQWRVFVWGKNIFNRYYSTNVLRVSDVIVRFPGMPATYGVTASVKF